MEIEVFADGASRGNPGLAGAGVVFQKKDGNLLSFATRWLGDSVTNNVAEYHAVIFALEEIIKIGYNKKHIRVFLYTDSELAVKQINGIYSVRSGKLYPLWQKAMSLIEKIPHIKISHRYRTSNKIADRLANLAIDFHLDWRKAIQGKKAKKPKSLAE